MVEPDDAQSTVGYCTVKALFDRKRKNGIILTIRKSIMEDIKPESIISFGYSFFLEEILMIIENNQFKLPVHRE